MFRQQPLIVVGGGDTAMEEALFLTRFAAKVTVVHRREVFRASRIMLARAREHEKIDILDNTVIDDVLGEDFLTGVRLRNVVNGEVSDMEVAGMFVAIGHQPNTAIFGDQLDTDDMGYLVTDAKSSRTNVAGVFACGDVQDKTYRQAITAAGSGCTAAIDCERYLEAQAG